MSNDNDKARIAQLEARIEDLTHERDTYIVKLFEAQQALVDAAPLPETLPQLPKPPYENLLPIQPRDGERGHVEAT